MKALGSWFRYLVLLSPVATVAGTAALYRYGSPVWQLYALYSLELLTHPLVAFFLILMAGTLGAAMINRRRHRSEVLAFCFLLSAVLHLLTVAFLSLWIVEQHFEKAAGNDGRGEVMTGLPPFSEGAVGEDLRGMLQTIDSSDERELDARARTERMPDTPLSRNEPEPAIPESALPETDRPAILVEQSAVDPAVEEQLEAMPTELQNRDTTKLVRVEPIEHEVPAKEPERRPASIPAAEPAVIPFKPPEQLLPVPVQPVSESARLDHARVEVKLTQVAPADPRVDESLHQRETGNTLDRLPMQIRRHETPAEREPAAVGPAVRDVSEAPRRLEERPVTADRKAASPAPELTPGRDPTSTVRMTPETPSFVRQTREVTEAQSRSSGSPDASLAGVVLDLAVERPLLPTAPVEPDRPQPFRPSPRTLAASKATEATADAPPMPDKPIADMPTVDQVPMASPVQTATVRPLEAPRVLDLLTQRPDTRPPVPPPALGVAMATLEAPRTERPVPEAPPTRALQPARSVRAPRRELPVTAPPVVRQRPPEAQPRQAFSLADAHQAQTAAPSVAAPTVSERLAEESALQVPTAITITVGGRLVLVESSPRVVALEPAPLPSRDIVTAYRREKTPNAAADVPLPATARVTELPDATTRVSQQSVAVSDSIRVLQPHAGAPAVDATLAAVTSGARIEIVEVNRKLSTITPTATGTVEQVRNETDESAFTQDRIAVHVQTASLPAAAHQTAADAARATDKQNLRVARAVFAEHGGSLPEEAIPPPRTTFIMRAKAQPSSPARLSPADLSRPLRRAEPAASANISDRLTDVGGATPAGSEAPVLNFVAGRNGAIAGKATGVGDRPGETARGRAFDVARTGSRLRPEPAHDAPRGVGALPRPELSDRAHDRGIVRLGGAGDSRATVVEDAMGSANDSVRALIAVEIAASRESPSKKAIYQLRSSDRRKLFIEELGGSVETESAVEQALDWLAAAQSEDGRWDVDDFKGADQCGGRGNQASADVGITGLTLLAFLGAGYTHVGDRHGAVVKNAIDWIVAGMGPDGDLRQGGQMYDQAMATAALCEAMSLTGDARLRPPAQRALRFILAAQNPEAAWRYDPREDNDTSVTGWQILALKSAEVAGLTVPAQHYRWTEKWLDQVRRGEQGGLYLYRAGHAVTPVMTAEGWFCQIFMGEQSNTRGQDESVGYLMQHLPVWSRDVPGAINFYYWYYATLALHLSGSESFGTWNDALTAALLQGRVSEGPAAGTWDPVSHIGVRGGRIYSTAVATLCLEVYYRFLPFYKLQ